MDRTKHVVSQVNYYRLPLTHWYINRLIYQLLDYERLLKSGMQSPAMSDRSSVADAEEQAWARRRSSILDDITFEAGIYGHQVSEKEAQDLDQAMLDRQAQRTEVKPWGDPGISWRSRMNLLRRKGSMTSTLTSSGSAFGDDPLHEEDEDVDEDVDAKSKFSHPAVMFNSMPAQLSAPRTPSTARPFAPFRSPSSMLAFRASFNTFPLADVSMDGPPGLSNSGFVSRRRSFSIESSTLPSIDAAMTLPKSNSRGHKRTLSSKIKPAPLLLDECLAAPTDTISP